MNKQRSRIATLWLAFAILSCACVAHASSLGLGSAEPGNGAPSPFVMKYLPWFEPVLFYINSRQQEFYCLLTHTLGAMRTDPWQVSWLVGISFLYGIFHAAGPGHGKAVISSYIIANETELRRGVVISFLSAFVQGAVAVLVTGAGFLILRGTTITMTDATKWLEVSSFAIIMLFGIYMLMRKLRAMLVHARPTVPSPDFDLALASAAHFREGADHAALRKTSFNHPAALATGSQICSVCGHAHTPSPEMVSGERFSLADGWTAIVAVGLRPCSGALIVLTFAFLNGLYLGGILSVIGMSLGTAITVSLLATLAVTAKGTALGLMRDGTAKMQFAHLIEIAAALVVILFGFTFLMASLQG